MSDEARTLRWAREVWRADPPTDSEIALGADRIAQRFAVPKRVWAPKSLMTTGAVAAVLGALAFGAGRARLAPRPSPAVMAHVAPPIAEAPQVATPAAVPQEGSAKVEPAVAAEKAPADAQPHRVPERLRRAAPPEAAIEPSWSEVSDALAANDHARAERLLRELASRGRDTNTRAKALLGLAQLDEARKDCEAARPRALRAASMPNVEIKTVRRALELAARCSR